MALAPGNVIAKRYRIMRLLGEGGFGAVYLGEDTRLGNKRVALKENFDNSPSAQDQFRLEAQLLATLDHASLPRVSDHFLEPDGRQFLVMDYIEGEDLHERVISTGRPLSEREAVVLMLQVCEAVGHLHSQRPQPIIHRDIKPPNIKLTPNGRAILVDFGIAKIYHPKKGTAKVAKAFTPHFSPPEQHGGKTDTRSDVYSLGATLYSMVCGSVPPDAMDRLTQNISVPQPRQYNPAITPTLAGIILRALELNPDRRFSDANQMAVALRAVLQGQQISPSIGYDLICPICSWQNRVGARFCRNDGTPLGTMITAQPILTSMPLQVQFEIANAYARNNNVAEAIPQYQACLHRGFTHAAVYHNLGFCYLVADRPSEAVKVLEQGAVSYPQDGDIQFQLARSYQKLNQMDWALACAGRAFQLAPKDMANLQLFGQMFLNAKRYNEVISQLKRAVQINPTSVTTHIWLGRAYGEAGDLKRAVAALRQAASLDPHLAKPHMWIGLFYYRDDKYQEAAQAFENVIRLDPSLSSAHFMLGEICLQQDKYEQAIPRFQQSIALDPRDPENHTRLGLCYALLGRKSEAIAALQRALSIDPRYQPARELLNKL